MESGSEHPLGEAIVTEAKSQGVEFGRPELFESTTGGGVAAVVDRLQVTVGTARFLASRDIKMTDEAERMKQTMEDQAKTVVIVAIEGRVSGLIAVADGVKKDSRHAIHALKEMGMNPVMITGDNERTARAIAAEVGIEEILANVLPGEKAEEVERLQERGERVAMVGDGINDAPALTKADVGIAIGTGTDIAIEAGDIVIVRGELSAVVKAVNLSQETFRKIKQNLFWAFVYNIVMIPLAIVGVLHPVLAEIAMAFSSTSVVTNSKRLQRVDLDLDTNPTRRD